MNEEQEKLLEELLDKLIDDNLENDINDGERLLNTCINYDNLSKLNLGNSCNDKHKILVMNYIQDIINRYSFLLRLCNMVNGHSGEGKSAIDCRSLGNYIEFLKRLKKAKKYTNDIEKIIKIIKGESFDE